MTPCLHASRLLRCGCSQTERRAVRGEAEGAAADLLRIARQHARDHKDRVRTFLADRLIDIKCTFDSDVAKYVPAPPSFSPGSLRLRVLMHPHTALPRGEVGEVLRYSACTGQWGVGWLYVV